MSDIKNYVPLWDKWEVESKIGSGLYGTVYKIKAQENGNTVYGAVKHIELVLPENADEIVKDDKDNEISVKEKLLNDYLNEIETNYSFIRSKNLLIYEEHVVFENENGYDIFVRMPYLENLTSILSKGQLSDKEKLQLGIDICSALADLQRRGVAHGDIKPNNIFRNQKGKFVLADFGIAKRPDSVLNKKAVKDTVAFMAPELQENKAQNNTSDIYSLGLLLYKLHNGNREPFIEENSTAEEKNEAILKRIKGVTFPAPENADKNLAKIILIACQFAPEARWMNADAFKSALLSYTPSKEKADSADVAEAVAAAVVANEVTESLLEEEPAMTVSEFEEVTPDVAVVEDDNVLTSDDIDAFADDDVLEAEEVAEIVNIEEKATKSNTDKPVDTSTKVFSLDSNNMVDDEDNYDNFSDPEFEFDEDEDNKKSKTPLIVVAVILILAILAGVIYVIVTSDVFGGNGSTPDSIQVTTEAELTTAVETQPQSTKATEATKATEEETKETEKEEETTEASDTVSVPDIIGWTYEDAEYQLSEYGLYISISNYEHSDYFDKNTVISMSPDSGFEAEEGSTISVVISLGPEEDTQQSYSSIYSYDSDYVFADSSSRALSRDEVIGLDENTLTIAINEIYARHGRKFVNQDLSNYFNSKSWYSGTIDPYVFDANENSYFNSVEKQNRDLIKGILYEKGYW